MGQGARLLLVLAHRGLSAALRTPSSSADSARSQGQYVGGVRALLLLPVTPAHSCPAGCPAGLPADSSRSSLRVPVGQIQRRGFCDLIFSTAEGSVVQKTSRLSHPTPNLVRHHVLNAHTCTLAHTHLRTLALSLALSRCPHRNPQTARRCHLRLSETHCLGQRPTPLRGAGGGSSVFTVDSSLPSRRRWFPLRCTLSRRIVIPPS